MGRDTKKLIDESLVYERAYSRVCRILNSVLEDKARDAEMSKDTGEPIDSSYKIVTDALGRLRDEFRNRETHDDRIKGHMTKAANNIRKAVDELSQM